ncbi:MAG: CHASE3 domain-containing protein [Candidatus Eremiobacteraeota bacterium]|nr:CHASE3 domain-containing protein [Candidatus Eremiobacteraeota bacterium]MCW5868123.1 CHASE3 domain-containing protein [Candidatus Eremiobacteraeota bacterium]
MSPKTRSGLRLGPTVRWVFGIIIGLVLARTLGAAWVTARMQADARLVERTFRIELALRYVDKLIVDAESGQRGFVYTGKEHYLDPYNNAVAEIPKAIEQIQALIVDRAQHELVSQLEPLIEAKLSELKETIDLRKAGREQECRQLVLSDRGKEVMDKFRAKLAEIDRVEEDLLEQRRSNAQRTTGDLNAFNWLSGLGVIAAALFCGTYLSRHVVGSIARVIHTLAATTAELSVAVEQHEAIAADQAAAVVEISTTTEELNASFRQVSDQSENALFRASGALDTANAGGTRVQATLLGVQNLEEKVRAVAEQISRLKEHTSQIGAITSFVTEVANQTNMLALNAAVEAARAGEHGRGFAVVAAEIRKLAEQSKTSAVRITALVGDTQTASRATAEASQEGITEVERVRRLADETADAFESIANAMHSVVESTQQASLNVRQQMMAVGQVAAAMVSLSNGSRQTSAGITQTRVGLVDIKGSAQELDSII